MHLFILPNNLENVRTKNKTKFWGSIPSGVTGRFVGGKAVGIITAEISVNLIYPVTTIIYIAKHLPKATAINMNIGELSF